MKTKLLLTAGMLSAIVSANAQITKNRKYDWGWSYKLEMPETGLKCEFPEKPVSTTLAYGYMTAASYKDELYLAAKLENPNPYDIRCRTEEFTNELRKIYNLPIADITWNEVSCENGNLTVTGNATGKWAQFHIDAIATEDVLTIFLYSNHNELSVPGHFFASSYSVFDIPEGNMAYTSEEKRSKRAKVLEYDNGRSLIRLENSTVTLEWPDIPRLEVNRHEAEYDLVKNGAHYSTRVIEVGPTVSYAFFNTFINREQQKLGVTGAVQVIADETEIPAQFDTDKEVFFRKMTFRTETGTQYRFYVAADSRIIVQELETASEPTAVDMRYLNTFEQSIRNRYDTGTFVLK